MFNSSMFIKSLQIGVLGLFLCVVSAWAGPASIQGVVKDAKGQPIKGADVQVESRDGKQLLNTVKTDAKGRYISEGLQPGVYRVSLVVNGATLTEAEVIGHCKARLEYFMVPRLVEFRKELPKTASGKIKKLELS